MLATSIIGSLLFFLTVILTRALIQASDRMGMIDSPNNRSSHSTPTPKGGGLGFSIIFLIYALAMVFWRPDLSHLFYPLLFGAPAVLLLGWLDDRFTLSARFRLAVHFLVAIFVYFLVTDGFKDPMNISFLPDSIWVSGIFCVLFISWFINLYNFMDGADGIAASTAVAGSVLLAVISFFHGSGPIAGIYCVIGYTVSGFLVYNWQPAKIFMGDTGSYFLGFVFATMALICKAHADISFYSSIVIFGFFIFDTTYVLFRRALRMEKLFQAHQMFIFHKLMRTKNWSHQKVSVLYTSVMVVWLFPLANLASIYDDYGMLVVVVAYAPLLGLAIWTKAGEEPT